MIKENKSYKFELNAQINSLIKIINFLFEKIPFFERNINIYTTFPLGIVSFYTSNNVYSISLIEK